MDWEIIPVPITAILSPGDSAILTNPLLDRPRRSDAESPAYKASSLELTNARLSLRLRYKL